jgi:hypothetical protein
VLALISQTIPSNDSGFTFLWQNDIIPIYEPSPEKIPSPTKIRRLSALVIFNQTRQSHMPRNGSTSKSKPFSPAVRLSKTTIHDSSFFEFPNRTPRDYRVLDHVSTTSTTSEILPVEIHPLLAHLASFGPQLCRKDSAKRKEAQTPMCCILHVAYFTLHSTIVNPAFKQEMSGMLYEPATGLWSCSNGDWAHKAGAFSP